MIDASKIFLAKQQIVKILRLNPHLRPLQDEIDQVITAAVTPRNALIMLGRFVEARKYKNDSNVHNMMENVLISTNVALVEALKPR
jgi:hypothetical protein